MVILLDDFYTVGRKTDYIIHVKKILLYLATSFIVNCVKVQIILPIFGGQSVSHASLDS